MKNLSLKFICILGLAVSMLILMPSTVSKYINQVTYNFRVEKVGQYSQVLANGSSKEYTLPYSGYYAIIARGTDGKDSSGNTGGAAGIVAGYFYLSANDSLTVHLANRDSNSIAHYNNYGRGNGGGVGNYYAGGAATVVTLDTLDARNDENILVIAAGGGGQYYDYYGYSSKGGGGSNVAYTGNATVNNAGVATVSGTLTGFVYYGQDGNGSNPGKGATTVGGTGTYPGSDFANMGTGGVGGYQMGGGGGYAGGAGAGAISSGGGGGSSFLSTKSGNSGALPQALYEELVANFKTTGGTMIEKCYSSGCTIIVYLGGSKDAILNFGS